MNPPLGTCVHLQSSLVAAPMSTELKTIRKKRTSSDATSPNSAPEGDHRKRRRNRTTQSCLNCHTSKRMCDRKRPCGRCTQLGLTGLCVYEVDDPGQRSDAQDESSRLRQRVAELEGVIRELKNKPNPRWTKSGSSPSEEFERCHAQARSRSASEDSAAEPERRSDPSQSPSKHPDADLGKETLAKQPSSLLGETPQADFFPSSLSPFSLGSSAPLSNLAISPFPDVQSPPSASSTGLVTPTEEHPQFPIAIAGDQPLNSDIDLASFLMSYSDMLACGEARRQVDHVFSDSTCQQVDSSLTNYNRGRLIDGHCGCLHEVASYNVVLELSLRLRKAADILSHSANHRFNNICPLNQRVVDLDTFATTVLGNMTTSPNDFGLVHPRSRASTAPSGPISTSFSPNGGVPSIGTSAIPPPPFGGLRSWNAVPCASDPCASCDGSFMTWESSRRS